MTPKNISLELRTLLLELAKQDVALANRAENALREVSERYLSARPYTDSDGGRSRPGISEDRAAVRKLEKRVAKLQDAISALSFHARLTLGQEMGTPLGIVTSGLTALSDALALAGPRLQSEDNKPGDYELNVWAFDVALVLRDILGIAPSATRVSATARHARGGAAYARLLLGAHELISRRSVDYGRLIDVGLKLLKNPTGDKHK